MSTFGEDLIQSLGEAIAHAKGNGPAILHTPVTPRAVRKQVNLTQAQMAIADGHESLRLPEMGAGNAAGQRPGRIAPTRDRKGTGSGQARVAVPGAGVGVPFQNKRVVWRP